MPTFTKTILIFARLSTKREPNARKEGNMATLKICVEIEFDESTVNTLIDNNIDFGVVEDLICKDITEVVKDELSDDLTLKECYAMGWDI